MRRRSGKVCDKSLSSGGGVSVVEGGEAVINNDKSGDPQGDVIFGTRVRPLTALPRRCLSSHPPADSDRAII